MRVGINQIVWDPASKTLHVESDESLDQHTRHPLIVTDGVEDATGDPVQASNHSRVSGMTSTTAMPQTPAWRRTARTSLTPWRRPPGSGPRWATS